MKAKFGILNWKAINPDLSGIDEDEELIVLIMRNGEVELVQASLNSQGKWMDWYGQEVDGVATFFSEFPRIPFDRKPLSKQEQKLLAEEESK